MLACYNGEQYLAEQLDSLLRQTCRQWTLYIHDDGSTDRTPQLIRSYAQNHPNIIVLDYAPQGGAMNNFLSMLQRIRADYYMFCDQDDVWLEDKVQISLDQMKQLEQQHADLPLVVYSDLYVTDADLNITNPSFWQEICLYPEFVTNFNEVGASTAITGCAMLFNQQAKDALPFPPVHATMHDAWISACVLRAGGHIHPIRQPLVYYRQHGGNCVGANDLNHITLGYRIRNFKQMQQKNWRLYRMLRALGYGSIVKFFAYKMRYKKLIKQKQAQQP